MSSLVSSSSSSPDGGNGGSGSPGGPVAPTPPPSPSGGGTINFTPGPVPATAPGWVASLTPGVWTAISINTVADVNPERDPAVNPNFPNQAPWAGNTGQAAVIEAWCGGALAYGLGAYGSFLIFGGGHQDYYGNEVYSFDLGNLRWSRLSNPYRTPQFGSINAYPDGRYPDGSPVPSHSTSKLGYHPRTNSFVTLEGEVNNFGGYTATISYMFSLESRAWRRSPRSSRALGALGWSTYDSVRDVFWVEGGYDGSANPFSKFDPNSVNADGTFGTWTNYVGQVSTLGTVADHDPERDIILATEFGGGTSIYAIDPKNPTTAGIRITHAGDRPRMVGSHGWEYSAVRRAFIYWAGAGVYELKLAPGSDWRTGTWTWTNITNPSNNVNPNYASNGVYSRFQVARYGNVEVAVTVNSVNGRVYAFRLP